MRSFLAFFTKNKFVGMLFGMIFCAIIQSSSATTVMVVSFVNAGLMNLFQAAGDHGSQYRYHHHITAGSF